MGCCASTVPDIIIPDPESGEKHKVMIKAIGMMSRDQYVYQDEDEDKKWLFLDKSGGIFSNPKYILENFVRDDDNKGQVLCCAKVDITDLTKCSKGEHVDSDVSDYTDTDDEVEVTVEKIKWAQKIKIKFYSDRDMDKKIGVMKVKAKGKAKKTTITQTEEDGTESVRYEVEKKCKKLLYKMEELEGHGEDELPPVELDGKLKGKESKLTWKSPMFESRIDGKKVFVETDWKNPGLAMLAGYICAKELAPEDICANVHIF